MNKVLGLFADFHSDGLFILRILGSGDLPFPADATFILCGLLIFRKLVLPAEALMTVYLVLFYADTIAFHLGRKYGRIKACGVKEIGERQGR